MVTETIRIDHLAAHPEVIPVLAVWEQQEWGHLLPEATFETFSSYFEERTVPARLPQTFVAVAGSTPVGMASLDLHDMTTRLELSPWLASVYVTPEFRNKGVGSRLVRTVMTEVKTLGLEKFYLITPNKMDFYRRLGWQVIEAAHYRGEEVVIMQYKIG